MHGVPSVTVFLTELYVPFALANGIGVRSLVACRGCLAGPIGARRQVTDVIVFARCAAVRLSPRGRHRLSSLTHSRLAKARRHSFPCLGWCCHRLSRQVFVRRHRSEGGTLA